MDKKEIERLGYYFARGASKYFALVVLIGVAFILILSFARSYDSSDVNRWDRSGLRIHTDQLTGVQYLSVAGGGITPRLDQDGEMMFERRGNE